MLPLLVSTNAIVICLFVSLYLSYCLPVSLGSHVSILVGKGQGDSENTTPSTGVGHGPPT